MIDLVNKQIEHAQAQKLANLDASFDDDQPQDVNQRCMIMAYLRYNGELLEIIARTLAHLVDRQ